MHLALTYDGDIGRVYIDGVLVEDGEPSTGGIPYDDAPLLIGIDQDSGVFAHGMEGRVDDVRVYARAVGR